MLEVHDILDASWESFEEEEVVESTHYYEPTPENVQEEGEAGERLKVFSKVSYLHRTVKDYLKWSAVRARLESHITFLLERDPNVSLLVFYMRNYKSSLHSFYLASEMSDWDRIWKTTSDVLTITRSIKHHNAQSRALLKEFYDSALQWWQKSRLCVRGDIGSWRTEFLSLTVYFGL